MARIGRKRREKREAAPVPVFRRPSSTQVHKLCVTDLQWDSWEVAVARHRRRFKSVSSLVRFATDFYIRNVLDKEIAAGVRLLSLTEESGEGPDEEDGGGEGEEAGEADKRSPKGRGPPMIPRL